MGHRQGCATHVGSPARRGVRRTRLPTEPASLRGRGRSDGSGTERSCWPTSQSAAAWTEPAPSSSSRSERTTADRRSASRAASALGARREEASRRGNMCSQGMLRRGRIGTNTCTRRDVASEFGLAMRIFLLTGCNEPCTSALACVRARPPLRARARSSPLRTHSTSALTLGERPSSLRTDPATVVQSRSREAPTGA